MLDRRQQKLELVLISPQSFVAVTDPDSFGGGMSNGLYVYTSASTPSSDSAAAEPVMFQVVASITSDTWVRRSSLAFPYLSDSSRLVPALLALFTDPLSIGVVALLNPNLSSPSRTY